MTHTHCDMLYRYWNWALDWEDVTKSPIFNDTNGFGGNGNASIKEPFLYGYCLTEGRFSRLKATLSFTWLPKPRKARKTKPGSKAGSFGKSVKPS